MAELTYRDAVAAGIAQEMARDEHVVFLGEDVAAAGGVFKATVGLLEKFGPKRVRDCPISEQAILGAAMGAAMTGLRPIAEIMFSDFLAVCWDIVANEIAKTRYMTDGQVSLPLVLRTANGAGLRFGAQHSQSVENWAMAIPGLKVVAPSNPTDVIGLMAAGCDRQKADAPQAPKAEAQSAKGLDRSHKGEAAPLVKFKNPDGGEFDLTKFKGGPVLVNLWASWCAPCIKELPTLQALEQGQVVVGKLHTLQREVRQPLAGGGLARAVAADLGTGEIEPLQVRQTR